MELAAAFLAGLATGAVLTAVSRWIDNRRWRRVDRDIETVRVKLLSRPGHGESTWAGSYDPDPQIQVYRGIDIPLGPHARA